MSSPMTIRLPNETSARETRRPSGQAPAVHRDDEVNNAQIAELLAAVFGKQGIHGGAVERC